METTKVLIQTPKSEFIFRSDSIFESGADILVNPVNCVGIMGKGLAKQFKKHYPKMYQYYSKTCEVGALRPGMCLQYYVGDHDTRFILNVATKDHWSMKSDINDVEKCVKEIYQFLTYRRRGFYPSNTQVHVTDRDITRKTQWSVALPAIGCGEGGLSYDDVYELFMKYLTQSPCDYGITYYLYQPR